MSAALRIDGPELIKGVAIPLGESALVGETRDGERRIYRESFDRASFAQVPDRTPFVRRHDRNNVLGWAKLRLTNKALEFEVEPLDTGNARDALAEVKSGLLMGVSIGFMANPERDEWSRAAGELPKVKRRGAELIEISLVARGAYPSALVTEVSRLSWQHQESEQIMAGYRKEREAKLVKARAESALLLSDVIRLGQTAPLTRDGTPVPLIAPEPTEKGGGVPTTPRAAQLSTGATRVDLGSVQLTVDAQGFEAEQLAHGYLDAVVSALRSKGSALTGAEMAELQSQHRVLA